MPEGMKRSATAYIRTTTAASSFPLGVDAVALEPGGEEDDVRNERQEELRACDDDERRHLRQLEQISRCHDADGNEGDGDKEDHPFDECFPSYGLSPVECVLPVCREGENQDGEDVFGNEKQIGLMRCHSVPFPIKQDGLIRLRARPHL